MWAEGRREEDKRLQCCCLVFFLKSQKYERWQFSRKTLLHMHRKLWCHKFSDPAKDILLVKVLWKELWRHFPELIGKLKGDNWKVEITLKAWEKKVFQLKKGRNQKEVSWHHKNESWATYYGGGAVFEKNWIYYWGGGKRDGNGKWKCHYDRKEI